VRGNSAGSPRRRAIARDPIDRHPASGRDTARRHEMFADRAVRHDAREGRKDAPSAPRTAVSPGGVRRQAGCDLHTSPASDSGRRANVIESKTARVQRAVARVDREREQRAASLDRRSSSSIRVCARSDSRLPARSVQSGQVDTRGALQSRRRRARGSKRGVDSTKRGYPLRRRVVEDERGEPSRRGSTTSATR